MVKNLEYLTIENFKCFKSYRMYLSNLTLLCGSNSSGKSTVCQPILLLSQAMRANNISAHQKINSLKWPLNGDLVNLGTVHDMYCNFINTTHLNFGFKFIDDDNSYTFKLGANREDSCFNIENSRFPENTNWKKTL